MGNASLDGGDGGASLDGNSPFILFIPSIPFVPSILLIPCEAHLTFHFSLFSSHLLSGLGYFLKIKYTAKTKQPKPARWFHLRGSPLTNRTAKSVKTTNEITSWITLSCQSVNGPPKRSHLSHLFVSPFPRPTKKRE